MKKLRYFFETALLRLAAWALPRLPRHVTLALARCLGRLAYHLDSSGRNTALENLRCAFHGEKTAEEMRRIARGSYENFARAFLDLLWSPSLNRENWEQHVRVHRSSMTAEDQARETGAMWVTPHYGNFEFVSLIWGWRDFQFTVVAQDFKNPGITPIFTRLRQHSGHIVIPQEAAMLRLMKALKRKGHAAMLTDLNIKPSRTAAAIRCFGLQTCVTTIHVTLAQRFGLTIVGGVCVPAPDGTYDVHVFEPLRPQPQDSPQKVAQQCWDEFEKWIRKHPECWMWMYKHWRYLPGTERDAAYPAYANPNRQFQKLVEAARS